MYCNKEIKKDDLLFERTQKNSNIMTTRCACKKNSVGLFLHISAKILKTSAKHKQSITTIDAHLNKYTDCQLLPLRTSVNI